MFPASLILVLLIVAAPPILIFDGPITQGVVVATAAVLVAIVGLRMRPGEASFLSSVIRPIAFVLAVPAIWMIVQVLPLGATGLAHPIWESAAAALGQPLAGTISIDPGATLISLARYLSVVAIIVAAAAVAVDRNRAKWLLFALTLATTLIGLIVLTAGLGSFTFLNLHEGGPTAAAAVDTAVLGIIISVATTFNTLEVGSEKSRGREGYRLAFVACLIAVAICVLASVISATSQTFFALTYGIATLAVAIIVRRFQPGIWGYSAIISVAIVGAIAIVALRPGQKTEDITVVLADRAPAPLIAVTKRILTNTRWMGTGAGTFSAILPVYRDMDELATGTIAPTTAAAIAAEMGRPFLWAALIAAITFVVSLLRGVARRGRDSFYSMAGASCTVALTLLALANAGVFGTPVLIVAGTTVGIAIAQSKSRSI